MNKNKSATSFTTQSYYVTHCRNIASNYLFIYLFNYCIFILEINMERIEVNCSTCNEWIARRRKTRQEEAVNNNWDTYLDCYKSYFADETGIDTRYFGLFKDREGLEMHWYRLSLNEEELKIFKKFYDENKVDDLLILPYWCRTQIQDIKRTFLIIGSRHSWNHTNFTYYPILNERDFVWWWSFQSLLNADYKVFVNKETLPHTPLYLSLLYNKGIDDLVLNQIYTPNNLLNLYNTHRVLLKLNKK